MTVMCVIVHVTEGSNITNDAFHMSIVGNVTRFRVANQNPKNDDDYTTFKVEGCVLTARDNLTDQKMIITKKVQWVEAVLLEVR